MKPLHASTEGTKHTPGPWKVDRSFPRQLPFGISQVNEPRQAVLTTQAFCRKTTDEGEANARLICAAPDLLAALEALCAWSDHSSLTGLPDGAPVADSAPCFDDTVKMVHAAIKKARGE